LTPNELVLTFRGSYVCANFGENRSRNATVRVLADGQTDTQTHTQTQTDFIICPMLYAIAMGQIISVRHWELNPDTIAHLSTNRARRRLNSLIEAKVLTTLPDHQTEYYREHIRSCSATILCALVKFQQIYSIM